MAELTAEEFQKRFPNLAKIQAIPEEKRAVVQEFIDWFFDEPDNDPIRLSPGGAHERGRRDLMGRFFGVDVEAMIREQDEVFRDFVMVPVDG